MKRCGKMQIEDGAFLRWPSLKFKFVKGDKTYGKAEKSGRLDDNAVRTWQLLELFCGSECEGSEKRKI